MADYAYNWATRTDRDGKPAGIYTSTPFPITEASSTYTVTTDEGATTYSLGTIYFVDGTLGGTTTTYLPSTRASTGGSYTAYATFAAAIAAQPNGNKTLLVRSGTYAETGIQPGAGTDNTHRYSIIGYNQERPIIDASSTTNHTIQPSGSSGFITIQRLDIRNNQNDGFRSNAVNGHLSLIDVRFYNNSRMILETDNYGDGNVYFLGSSDVQVIHCNSEHSDGHGYKIGDGVVNALVEWSIAQEAGYWSGYMAGHGWGTTPRSVGHPTTLDFPSDNTGGSPMNQNCTARYNIITTSLFYAVQFRHTQNFSFHHNEVSGGIQFNNVPGSETRSLGGLSASQVLLYESTTYGSCYSNWIHDPGKLESGAEATGIRCTALVSDISHPVLIYNNLVTGHDNQPSISSNSNNTTLTVGIYNNTIYSGATSSDNGALHSQYSGTIAKNNIVRMTGTGQAAEFSAGAHTYNLYYAPSGSVGITLGTGELNSDPLFSAPGSDWHLQSSSPARGAATNLSGTFTSDLDSFTRSMWDMGAYAYTGAPFRLGFRMHAV